MRGEGTRKLRTITTLLVILLLANAIPLMTNMASSQTSPIMKILESSTGSNSTTLGNASEPVPVGGFPFSVNVTLEGQAGLLKTYQVAVGFDRKYVRCTGGQIDIEDPNFVFYTFRDQAVTSFVDINNYDGYASIGTALVFDYVNVSGSGLLCRFDFTAIKAGNSTLRIIPTETPPRDSFLWDPAMHYISFTSTSFNVSTSASGSPPIASFVFTPTNPVTNENVTFYAVDSYDPDGNITSYVWDFGDGTGNVTTSEYMVTHGFPANRTYDVKLTVKDEDNMTAFVTNEVQVGLVPQPAFSYSPQKIAPYDTVTFNASASHDPDGSIASYVWDFGDGANQTTDISIATHSYSHKGVFNVNLTTVDNDGLHNSTAAEVVVGNRPIADFTYTPTTPSVDEAVFFNASLSHAADSGDSIARLIWDFGDLRQRNVTITDSGSWGIQHTYLSESTFDVNLTVYDNNGLSSSVLQTISVVEPAPDITLYIVIAVVAAVVMIVAIVMILKRIRRAETTRKVK